MLTESLRAQIEVLRQRILTARATVAAGEIPSPSLMPSDEELISVITEWRKARAIGGQEKARATRAAKAAPSEVSKALANPDFDIKNLF